MDSTQMIEDFIANINDEMILKAYKLTLSENPITMEECIDNIEYFSEVNIMKDLELYIPEMFRVDETTATARKAGKTLKIAKKTKAGKTLKIAKKMKISNKTSALPYVAYAAPNFSGCAYGNCRRFVFKNNLCKQHLVLTYPDVKCTIAECQNIISSKFSTKKLCLRHGLQERKERLIRIKQIKLLAKQQAGLNMISILGSAAMKLY